MTRATQWPTLNLGDVVSLQRGFDLPAQQRRPGPFPVLTSGEGGGFHAEGPISGPGVTIGRATNLGQPKWSESDFWPHNTTLFVKDFHGNHPRWVFHLFESLDLSGYDSGSVQPMLNRNYVARVQVRVPPLDEQRAIAEVLGAIDNKIATNSRLVEALDALSRARLLPMLDDAEPQPLSDMAEFVNGRAFTKDASGTGRVVIRIAELNSGLGASTVYNDIDVDDKHLARPGDLLFAWSGSLTVHRWYRPEGIVNQHIFKVIPKDGIPMWCVNGVLHRKLAEFRAIAADKATTMGHIQRRHLDEPVLVPRPEVIERHGALMTGLWKRALAAETESERLEATRDALLPLLMSGKVTVRDAESVVGGVV